MGHQFELQACLLGLARVSVEFETQLRRNVTILALRLLELDHVIRGEALRAVRICLEACLDHLG